MQGCHVIAAPVPPEVVHALLLVAGGGVRASEAAIQDQRHKRFHHMLEVWLELGPHRALVREQQGLDSDEIIKERARGGAKGQHGNGTHGERLCVLQPKGQASYAKQTSACRSMK